MTLVSENIRYLRKLNGLTQDQFSRKINIKRSLLGAYEEARANPNQQNIQAIAKAFNTTIELLTRQDLRKLRETPNLSIPLGQSAKAPDVRIRPDHADGPTLRSDGKIVDDDSDDPFQHPDFPDIFARPGLAQPGLARPEPQPLSSVLNKYYRTPEEPRDVPRPAPVIRSPERPGSSPSGGAGAGGPAFPPVESGSPADRGPASRPAEPIPFNNVYEGRGPWSGIPSSGIPSSGIPSSGIPSSGIPSSGIPSSGIPSSGIPSSGIPALRGEVALPNPPAQWAAPTIPVVMQPQFGEYNQRHQQAEFLHRLPAMHLPMLPDGHYRAFEAGDDFTFPGALLIGQFVRNWFDIADGKLYVLLLQNAGVCCRRVYNQVKIKGTLLLTADRADIPNHEAVLKEVLEVWEVRAFVSQELPSPAPNTDRLRQLVDELQLEVGRL